MKRYLLATTLALCSYSFAADASKTMSTFDQGDEKLDKAQYAAAYNAPARIQVSDGFDLQFSGSFIYWHVAQDNMDLGTSANGGSPIVAQQKFEYKPGFQLGMLFNTNKDDWTIGIDYTWLHQSKIDSNFTSSEGSVWRLGASPEGSISNSNILNSSWEFHLDVVDLYASRAFYQGRALTVTPYAGLKAAWITQHLDIGSGDIVTPQQKSSNWMLGPSAGLETNLLLGMGFRLESSVDASLLYTKFTHITGRETLSAAGTSSDGFSTVSPVIEMALGLGWGTYFCDNNAHFDLSAGYNFGYWWNQNQMNALVKSPGDIAMQGLTIKAAFDF